MKAFKAFIKSFEAPQRSVKIKTYLNFFLFVGDWDGKDYLLSSYQMINCHDTKVNSDGLVFRKKSLFFSFL